MSASEQRLAQIVGGAQPTPEMVAGRQQLIRDQLLQGSRWIDGLNFRRVHPHALAAAFDAYDEHVFDGCCRGLLDERRYPIDFKFSRRMTKTGGMTVRHETYDRFQRVSSTTFEIKLSATLLLQSFQNGNGVLVSGCRCTTRLDAMLRIVEHEMIHLIEMLLWRDSSCSRKRFRGIAYRLFEHTESTHQLLTPIEVAQQKYGIRRGDDVVFEFQGRRYRGRVNRITRRATVLVRDPRGEPYSDGQRYRKFYVPLAALRPARS